jgi:hypothetical protein
LTFFLGCESDLVLPFPCLCDKSADISH